MKKPIVLIKIGGSLITDKNKPFKVNNEALRVIVKEIGNVVQKTEKQLIVGHGAGSFAHVPAKKYNTISGVKTEKELFGMAKVCDAACQLNRIVVKELLKVKLAAVSVSPFGIFLSENFKLKKINSLVLKRLLEMKSLPVVYGDVIIDIKKGCTIFSTERVLGYLGQELIKDGFEVEKIIHCGKTDGVYDENGKTIPLINKKNFEKYKKALTGSGGIDVTGGMIHKVEESLKLAEKGISGLIIDGVEKGSLLNAVLGKDVLGTRISA